MKRILAAALLACACMALPATRPAHAASFTPPGLDWRTIETAHFRVHFPAELRDIARKAARFGEEAHEHLGPYFGREHDKTDMTILDTEDTTNGFATPFPETSLTFFVTPPSPEEEWHLGRYDNWLKMIIVHEYTHVLHLRSAAGPGGVPGLINSAFIRAFLPEFAPLVNLDFLPDFMKEGLAVYWESALTGGGRAVEGQFDMILRTQFHAGQPFGIDQASGKYQLDWAPGGVNYSYGTLFFKYLAAEYGPNAAADLTHGLGAFPWGGINLASARTLGRSTYDIWDQTLGYFQDRYSRQIAEINQSPLTEAQSVTTDGRVHRHPRWLGNDRLLYSRSPLEGKVGLVATDLGGTDEAFVLAKSSRKDYSLTADDSKLYYYAGGDGPPLTSFYDIYRLDMGSKQSKQLTHGLRAFCPAVSPDGERIMVVLNGSGRNDLGMIDPYGKLLWRFRGPEFGSFANPVWSPDGKVVALSQWVDGRTNVMLFDPEARTLRPAAPENAVQLFPAWSPDGQYLLFSSDRTGVMNLYAVRLADGRFFRITNVVGGAFDPAVSPDMSRLAFSAYEPNGWNIKVMPYQPDTWAQVPGPGRLAEIPDIRTATRLRIAAAAATDAAPAKTTQPPESYPTVVRTSDRSPNPDVLETDAAPERAYNPFQTMLPQNLWPRVLLDLNNSNSWPQILVDQTGRVVGIPEVPGVIGRLGGAGPAFFLLGYGNDVLRQHFYFGSMGIYSGINRLAGSIRYDNDQLPPTLSLGFSVFPEVIGPSPATSGFLRLFGREERSLFAGISYPPLSSRLVSGNWLTGIVGNFNVRARRYNLFVSEGAVNVDFDDPLPLDQAGRILVPQQINTVGISFSGNDSDRPARPFSPVGGPLWTVGFERSDQLIGSDLGYWKAWGEGRYFAKLGGRNVLALRGLTGVNFSDPQTGSRIFINNAALLGLYPFDRNFFALGERLATASAGSFPDIGYGSAKSAAIHSYTDLSTVGEPDAIVPLRGFPFGVQAGLHMALLSAEYRIPILEIQRGLGTIPVFFDRVTVAPFVDVGKAWVVWGSQELLTGVGVESRTHMTLAQGIPTELRLGYARGLGNVGVHQVILGVGAVW